MMSAINQSFVRSKLACCAPTHIRTLKSSCSCRNVQSIRVKALLDENRTNFLDKFKDDQTLVASTSEQRPEQSIYAAKLKKKVSRAWSPALALSAAALACTSSPALAHVIGMSPIMDIGFSIPGIVGDSPLREGFVSGFLLIFFSEIGDKTFFIALLLALKQPKSAVFTGTFGALAVMTVISVLLGQTLHQLDELIPQDSAASKIPFDDLVAAALLIWFGVKTLQDAKDAAETAQEEKEEAQEVVQTFGAEDTTKIILSTFALVFAAEWGDKSFLATIALAAASSPLGVVTGAVAGHGVATGIAVAGGSVLSKYFSESFLQYVGGTLFLVFAAATLIDLVV
ncbi:hypothetical protein CEUSTIGMA_g581.t1 [Chlamydomonas eustigma]|uniref:GDT1 family protein n=1 Tax=Chlamydomonas eustigma TaxID=1157962 RepID=A0A250WQN1_9CHLO|nr:hypothetical protein CEUSTIGMA_g581.t1 [Chlamydomonas eustigma]|eukprot:GAX73128.1 hypothetical protein CEUSTIGMA_g581.t1 [Chlamydomonas eustigma]